MSWVRCAFGNVPFHFSYFVSLNQVVSSLSFLSTLLVAWDQYLAVLRPLRYHHHITIIEEPLPHHYNRMIFEAHLIITMLGTTTT